MRGRLEGVMLQLWPRAQPRGVSLGCLHQSERRFFSAILLHQHACFKPQPVPPAAHTGTYILSHR